MSFRLQIKGLDNSKEIRQRIIDDLNKVVSSLDQQPPILNVFLVAEGGLDRYKCSINWMPKNKRAVHVEKTGSGPYLSFRAAFDAVREAARRRCGKRRKLLLGI